MLGFTVDPSLFHVAVGGFESWARHYLKQVSCRDRVFVQSHLPLATCRIAGGFCLLMPAWGAKSGPPGLAELQYLVSMPHLGGGRKRTKAAHWALAEFLPRRLLGRGFRVCESEALGQIPGPGGVAGLAQAGNRGRVDRSRHAWIVTQRRQIVRRGRRAPA